MGTPYVSVEERSLARGRGGTVCKIGGGSDFSSFRISQQEVPDFLYRPQDPISIVLLPVLAGLGLEGQDINSLSA